MLMTLGPCQTWREQQQPQSSQQTAEQTAHEQEVSQRILTTILALRRFPQTISQ
ncbi:hypothetical protein SynRS9902_02189 [Synechococcus sp. RS9902]|nr:hypothetical protein SynRS9902_02189 [Synechococcus sp. RS9902]